MHVFMIYRYLNILLALTMQSLTGMEVLIVQSFFELTFTFFFEESYFNDLNSPNILMGPKK